MQVFLDSTATLFTSRALVGYPVYVVYLHFSISYQWLFIKNGERLNRFRSMLQRTDGDNVEDGMSGYVSQHWLRGGTFIEL